MTTLTADIPALHRAIAIIALDNGCVNRAEEALPLVLSVHGALAVRFTAEQLAKVEAALASLDAGELFGVCLQGDQLGEHGDLVDVVLEAAWHML